jgi:two-component system, chemotaxis family, protein-glutamate methylesterase/glutaminase
VTRRDLVVVGASAGGVEALQTLLGCLPADLAAAVLVVLHMPSTARSALPLILGRVSTLPVRQAMDGDPLEPGMVSVAVPDRHLMVVGDEIVLSRGPRENGHRPAVDVLFRSAARARGPRVVCVVLSGALDDGTAGMIAVRARGGLGVAQDPEEAAYSSMPIHAIEVAGADHVAGVEKIGELLCSLLAEDIDPDAAAPPSGLMEKETAVADLDSELLDAERPGTPSGFGCPSCGGSLFSITEGRLERFRCRVGHAWSPEALAEEQAQAVEGAIWMAMRALSERSALSLRMGERAEQRGHGHSAESFRRRHAESQQALELLRRLLDRGELSGDVLSDEVGGD